MQIKAWDRVARETNFNLEIDTPGFINLVSKDEKVLDYGCGYGRISEHLHLKGYNRVVGVDTSEEMIKRGHIENPHLLLELAQGMKLNYPDGVFDAVVVCAVFTCLPEQQQKQKALTEIKRVLKPGGVLHVVEFCNEANKIFESKIGIVMHHQNPNDLRNLLNAFNELSFIVSETQTMAGNNAQAATYFGRKNT